MIKNIQHSFLTKAISPLLSPWKGLKKTKALALTLLLLVCTAGTVSAQNLITNPSFEELTTPGDYPEYESELYKTKGWSQPTAGTSDYYYVGHNTTATNIFFKIPSSPQQGLAHTGAFAESLLSIGFNNYKEYLTNKLASPLVAGTTYKITFYTSHIFGSTTVNTLPPDRANFTDLPAVEQGFLGIAFSTTPPTAANTSSNGASTQVLGSGGILNSWNADKRALIPASNTAVYGAASRNAWVPVTLTYTAKGGEEYMTVGQWREDGTSLPSLPYPSYGNSAYYLYDNFTITAASIQLSNTCPATTVDLSSLHTATPPAGSSMVWYDGDNPDTATQVADPAAVDTSGTYYAFYYDNDNDCYSPASMPVVVTIEYCDPCDDPDVLEFASGDGNPTGVGPVQNTAVRFRHNTDNPAGNTFQTYDPAVTVNFGLTNHQYALSAIPTGRPVNIGYQNAPGAGGSLIFNTLNAYGAPLDTWFTSYASPAGQGITTANNYGIVLNTTTSPLRVAGAATTGVAHHMADLVVTFSQPVNNPVLHLGGLGSRTSLAVPNQLGFSQEYDLVAANVPVTLTKLSGSNAFTVSGTNIRNTAATGQMNSTGTDNSGSGSVKIVGTGIITLTLRISVRGDGTLAATTAWSDTNTSIANGDGATLSFSIGNCEEDEPCYENIVGNDFTWYSGEGDHDEWGYFNHHGWGGVQNSWDSANEHAPEPGSPLDIYRTATTQPGTTGGFVFDIYAMDNSFNMEINGIKLANQELQFEFDTADQTPGNVQFTDGTYTGNGVPDIWELYGDKISKKPIIRIVLNSDGLVTLYGSKASYDSPDYLLEEMQLINGNTFNTVTWNESTDNEVIISQLIASTTMMVGNGYGRLEVSCDVAAPCTKPGVAGTALTSSVGILTKGDPSVTGWPESVPNGYIVLDAANKGMVITHMTSLQRNALDPVEGMMIYNTTENCVQIYRGESPLVNTGRTGWNCIEQGCNEE